MKNIEIDWSNYNYDVDMLNIRPPTTFKTNQFKENNINQSQPRTTDMIARFQISNTELVEAEFLVLKAILIRVSRGIFNCLDKDREKYLEKSVEFACKSLGLLNKTHGFLPIEQKKEFNASAKILIEEAKEQFFVENEECFEKFLFEYYVSI